MTHVGDPEETPCCRLWNFPAPAIAAFEERTSGLEELSLSLCKPALQTKTNKSLEAKKKKIQFETKR